MPTNSKGMDWLAEAKANVTRPRLNKSYRRFLIYGRNKKGKTTFGLSAGVEKTLVIDPERGTDVFRKSNPYVWHVKRWEDMRPVLEACKAGKLSPHLLGLGESREAFDWVLVDGMTRINNMALRYIMHMQEERDITRRPGIVDRRDYNKSGELMKEMILQFQALPMNVCYTSWERMITMEEGEEGGSIEGDEEGSSVYYVPDLPQGVRGLINGVVEVIGRIYVIRDNDDKPRRRLFVGYDNKYDTGYRSDYSPPPILKSPTIPKLTAALLGTEAAGTS